MSDVLLRLAPKIDFTSDCWIWTAAKDGKGYARFGYQGKNRRAHRLLYELVVGPIPAGLELDHLCRNTSCVNPDHLEAVTRSTNTKRGDLWQYRRTHCPRGHLYDYFYKGERGCLRCNAAASRRAYLRKRGG